MIRSTGAFVVAVAAMFLSIGACHAAAPARVSQPAADAGGGAVLSGQAPAPKVWPRTFSSAGNTLLMYQPQVDGWDDFQKIRFRAAVAVTPAGTSRGEYGVVAVRANTVVDHDARTVLMTNLDVAVRFRGLTGAEADGYKAMVTECLPSLDYLDISLD